MSGIVDDFADAISSWAFNADHFRPRRPSLRLDIRLDANARYDLAEVLAAIVRQHDASDPVDDFGAWVEASAFHDA